MMDYGEALNCVLHDDYRVARQGWNGKGMFVFLVREWSFDGIIRNHNEQYENLPFLALKSSRDRIVPWTASQEDVQAEDWIVV